MKLNITDEDFFEIANIDKGFYFNFSPLNNGDITGFRIFKHYPSWAVSSKQYFEESCRILAEEIWVSIDGYERESNLYSCYFHVVPQFTPVIEEEFNYKENNPKFFEKYITFLPRRITVRDAEKIFYSFEKRRFYSENKKELNLFEYIRHYHNVHVEYFNRFRAFPYLLKFELYYGFFYNLENINSVLAWVCSRFLGRTLSKDSTLSKLSSSTDKPFWTVDVKRVVNQALPSDVGTSETVFREVEWGDKKIPIYPSFLTTITLCILDFIFKNGIIKSTNHLIIYSIFFFSFFHAVLPQIIESIRKHIYIKYCKSNWTYLMPKKNGFFIFGKLETNKQFYQLVKKRRG